MTVVLSQITHCRCALTGFGSTAFSSSTTTDPPTVGALIAITLKPSVEFYCCVFIVQNEVFSQDIYAGISYIDVSPSSSSPEMFLYVSNLQNKVYASVNL